MRELRRKGPSQKSSLTDWRILFFSLINFSQSRVAPGASGSCEGVYCRAGRECVLTSDTAPACVCVKECPDHWKPVSQYFSYFLLQLSVSASPMFDVVRFVALMESPMTTTVISTRRPAIPGNTSHLGRAASVGRNYRKAALMFSEVSSLGCLLPKTT